MKKRIVIGLLLALVLASFVACGENKDDAVMPEETVKSDTRENEVDKNDGDTIVEDMAEGMDDMLDGGDTNQNGNGATGSDDQDNNKEKANKDAAN